MKNLLLTSIAALLLIFAASCRKDEVITTTEENPPVPVVVEYTDAEIYGRVINNEGNPITDAQVTWGSENAQTDENGFFSLNSTVKEKNAILKVEKTGYFSALQTLQTIENVTANTTVQLVERTLSGTIQANTGGVITTNEQGSIQFAANSFVDSNGNAYTGAVEVYAYYLDPTIDDLKEIMPGNLTAINAENTPQLLTSYGMMNVELEDAVGNPLQLSANASLTTPVPASLQGAAPASIPLWYFDIEAGTWREEGSATLQGDVYVGEVAHFTWWNCDVPEDFIYLEGQVDGGPNGTPVLTVKITDLSTGQFGAMDTYDKGNFAGPVPINQTLLLEVFDICNALLYSEEIGPFSVDTELPLITIDLSDLDYITFTGLLTDCDGSAVDNGYVVLYSDDNSLSQVILPNNQGVVTATFADCGFSSVEYFGVDLTGLESSTPATTTLTENTNVGTISACGNEVVEAFELILNGETMVWTPCTAQLGDGGNPEEFVYSINTTHEQAGGSVNYQFSYLNWTGDPSNPEWALSYNVEIIGEPELIYDFQLGVSGLVELEVVANGEVPGSLLHLINSNILVENQTTGEIYENSTINIRATITE